MLFNLVINPLFSRLSLFFSWNIFFSFNKYNYMVKFFDLFLLKYNLGFCLKTIFFNDDIVLNDKNFFETTKFYMIENLSFNLVSTKLLQLRLSMRHQFFNKWFKKFRRNFVRYYTRLRKRKIFDKFSKITFNYCFSNTDRYYNNFDIIANPNLCRKITNLKFWYHVKLEQTNDFIKEIPKQFQKVKTNKLLRYSRVHKSISTVETHVQFKKFKFSFFDNLDSTLFYNNLSSFNSFFFKKNIFFKKKRKVSLIFSLFTFFRKNFMFFFKPLGLKNNENVLWFLPFNSLSDSLVQPLNTIELKFMFNKLLNEVFFKSFFTTFLSKINRIFCFTSKVSFFEVGFKTYNSTKNCFVSFSLVQQFWVMRLVFCNSSINFDNNLVTITKMNLTSFGVNLGYLRNLILYLETNMKTLFSFNVLKVFNTFKFWFNFIRNFCNFSHSYRSLNSHHFTFFDNFYKNKLFNVLLQSSFNVNKLKDLFVKRKLFLNVNQRVSFYYYYFFFVKRLFLTKNSKKNQFDSRCYSVKNFWSNFFGNMFVRNLFINTQKAFVKVLFLYKVNKNKDFSNFYVRLLNNIDSLITFKPKQVQVRFKSNYKSIFNLCYSMFKSKQLLKQTDIHFDNCLDLKLMRYKNIQIIDYKFIKYCFRVKLFLLMKNSLNIDFRLILVFFFFKTFSGIFFKSFVSLLFFVLNFFVVKIENKFLFFKRKLLNLFFKFDDELFFKSIFLKNRFYGLLSKLLFFDGGSFFLFRTFLGNKQSFTFSELRYSFVYVYFILNFFIVNYFNFKLCLD